MFKILD